MLTRAISLLSFLKDVTELYSCYQDTILRCKPGELHGARGGLTIVAEQEIL